MEKVRFNNMDEFTSWYNGKDATNVKKNPTVFEDKQFIALNMFTECKNWKAALNRFADTFLEDYNSLPSWIDRMQEWAEKEIFHPYHNDKLGSFTWALKKMEDGHWFITLLIEGAYK